MEKQFVTTSESPKVMLEIHGNLRLKGWDDAQVAAKTDTEDNLSIEQQEDTIRVRSFSDCKVSVPRHAIVTVESAYADATVKGLEGELTLQEVHGNLTIHGAGPTTIQVARADLTVKNVAGDLKITTVNGNATVRDVQGDFIVSDQVHGDLTLSDVSGNASAKVGGNASLNLDPAPGEQYDFTGSSDVACRLPADASVAVKIARAGQVTVKNLGVDISKPGNEPIEFTLGEGDAQLKLDANGNVFISSQAPGWEAFGQFGFDFGKRFEDMGKQFEGIGEQFEGVAESISQQFTDQIEAQADMIGAQIEAQLANLGAQLGGAGLSDEQKERINERARQASERATERVQEKLRRAQEKLDRKIAEAQRRAEQRARDAERRAHIHERHAGIHERQAWRFNFPTSPVPPTPPSEPVSDDERMVILRMLEQKKISPEQAEDLLSALEGKGA